MKYVRRGGLLYIVLPQGGIAGARKTIALRGYEYKNIDNPGRGLRVEQFKNRGCLTSAGVSIPSFHQSLFIQDEAAHIAEGEQSLKRRHPFAGAHYKHLDSGA